MKKLLALLAAVAVGVVVARRLLRSDTDWHTPPEPYEETVDPAS